MMNSMSLKETKTCCIFGAAPLGFSPEIPQGSLIIAADGGLRHLLDRGIRPDTVLGDFDSLGAKPSVECELIALPVEKDDTDTGFAVKTALSRGCRRIFLLGGSGGERPDHTLANLQTLVYIAKHGAQGFLTDGRHAFTALSGASKLSFGAVNRGNISVFSAEGAAEGVTLHGLKYPLENATLTGDFPLGVSNSFLPKGEEASVEVKSGSLWVCFDCSDIPLCDYPAVNSLPRREA